MHACAFNYTITKSCTEWINSLHSFTHVRTGQCLANAMLSCTCARDWLLIVCCGVLTTNVTRAMHDERNVIDLWTTNLTGLDLWTTNMTWSMDESVSHTCLLWTWTKATWFTHCRCISNTYVHVQSDSLETGLFTKINDRTESAFRLRGDDVVTDVRESVSPSHKTGWARFNLINCFNSPISRWKY